MELNRIILRKSTRAIDILHVCFAVRRHQLDMENCETSRIHVGLLTTRGEKDMNSIAFVTMLTVNFVLMLNQIKYNNTLYAFGPSSLMII